ncbi:MAG: DHHA1 domain-containing protein, partial [Tannerellaceae bacterium]|nr:DHHA1 domain-containing protein [Tannerellaceae bacterium]
NNFGYKTGDTEGFVNLLLNIDGVDFSVFIRQDKEYTKISFRSVGDFPSNQFAAAYFNGGGHKNASGGEYYGSIEDALNVFEEGLKEFKPNNY